MLLGPDKKREPFSWPLQEYRSGFSHRLVGTENVEFSVAFLTGTPSISQVKIIGGRACFGRDVEVTEQTKSEPSILSLAADGIPE